MLVFFTNLSLIEFQVRYLTLFLLSSVREGFGRFWVGSLHQNIQLMLESLKGLFLVLILMTFLIMLPVILLFMLIILLSKCDQTSDLWQQLESASELEPDLKDTVDWSKKWLVDFNVGKTQLILFDWSNNTGAMDVKMNGSVLEEKLYFKILGLSFSTKFDWGSYIISIAKTVSKKLEFSFVLFVLVCFVSL